MSKWFSWVSIVKTALEINCCMQIFTQTILIVQYNKKQLSAVWPDVQTPKIQGKGYHTIKFTKYNLMCIQCSIINLYIWRMDHTKSLLCWCKWLNVDRLTHRWIHMIKNHMRFFKCFLEIKSFKFVTQMC